MKIVTAVAKKLNLEKTLETRTEVYDEKVVNAVVASTKTLNKFVQDNNLAGAEIKQTDVYVSNYAFGEIVNILAKDMNIDATHDQEFYKYVQSAFELTCIKKREKQQDEDEIFE